MSNTLEHNDLFTGYTRRDFIELSVLAGFSLAWPWRSLWAQTRSSHAFLTDEEFRILSTIARTMIPDPPDFPNAHEWVAERADFLLSSFEARRVARVKELLQAFNTSWKRLSFEWVLSKSFTEMNPKNRSEYIYSWRDSSYSVHRKGYLALKRLVMGTYYSNEVTWKAVGYPGVPDISKYAKLGELDLP